MPGFGPAKTGRIWPLRSCREEEGSRQILEPRDEGDTGDMEMTKGIEGDKG